MARQSFQFGKRQREIAKKQKKEEKKLKRAERLAGGHGEEAPEAPAVEAGVDQAPETDVEESSSE